MLGLRKVFVQVSLRKHLRNLQSAHYFGELSQAVSCFCLRLPKQASNEIFEPSSNVLTLRREARLRLGIEAGVVHSEDQT